MSPLKIRSQRPYAYALGRFPGGLRWIDGVYPLCVVEPGLRHIVVRTRAPVRRGDICRIFLFTPAGLVWVSTEVLRARSGRALLDLRRFDRGGEARLAQALTTGKGQPARRRSAPRRN